MSGWMTGPRAVPYTYKKDSHGIAKADQGHIQHLVYRLHRPPCLMEFEGFLLRIDWQAWTLAPRAFSLGPVASAQFGGVPSLQVDSALERQHGMIRSERACPKLDAAQLLVRIDGTLSRRGPATAKIMAPE